MKAAVKYLAAALVIVFLLLVALKWVGKKYPLLVVPVFQKMIYGDPYQITMNGLLFNVSGEGVYINSEKNSGEIRVYPMSGEMDGRSFYEFRGKDATGSLFVSLEHLNESMYEKFSKSDEYIYYQEHEFKFGKLLETACGEAYFGEANKIEIRMIAFKNKKIVLMAKGGLDTNVLVQAIDSKGALKDCFVFSGSQSMPSVHFNAYETEK